MEFLCVPPRLCGQPRTDNSQLVTRKLMKALRPLRHRDFRLLIGGQTISWVGNNFYEIAIMWLVLRSTGSTAAMAGVAAVSVIPQLIFAPLAGVVADRVNRRFLALSMDLCRGVVILALPTLAVLHHLAIWQVYITAFVMFTLFTFFIPTRQAILPNIVPDDELPAANALFQMVLSGSLFVGFALGGLVVAWVGVVPALYLDSISFAGSVLSLLFMRSSGRSAMVAERTGAVKEAIAGLRFVASVPSLLAIFAFLAVTGFFIGPLLILSAPFSEMILHAGARGYGFLEAGLMLGTLIGALLAGIFGTFHRVGALLIVLVGIAGVLLMGMSYMTVLLAAIAFYLAIGVLSGTLNVPLTTLMQRLTPDAMRGRVMSTMMIVNTAGTPLSLAVGGIVAQRIGVPAMYRVEGVLLLATAAVFAFTPLVRVVALPPPSDARGDRNPVAPLRDGSTPRVTEEPAIA